jgi:hypothetical protein
MERDTPCTFTVLVVEKGYTLHIHTACGRKRYILTSTQLVGEKKTTPMSTLLTVDRDTPSRSHCRLWKWIYPHFHTDVVETYIPLQVNTRMPEKVSPASAFLPVVNRVCPASAFRHQGQSGTTVHGLVRHSLAMCSIMDYGFFPEKFFCSMVYPWLLNTFLVRGRWWMLTRVLTVYIIQKYTLQLQKILRDCFVLRPYFIFYFIIHKFP